MMPFNKSKEADEISFLIEKNKLYKEKIKINEESIKILKDRFKAIHLEKYEDYIKCKDMPTL